MEGLSHIVLIEFRRTFKKELARIPDDEFLTKGEVASRLNRAYAQAKRLAESKQEPDDEVFASDEQE